MLHAIVEFPDGLRRPIKVSRLFVDGKLVNEITTEPFTSLVWPLDAYTTSGPHVLRVEMEDILGLSRSSIEIPVNVEVEAAPSFNLALMASAALPYLPYAGAAGAGAAGVNRRVGWAARLAQTAAKISPIACSTKKQRDIPP